MRYSSVLFAGLALAQGGAAGVLKGRQGMEPRFWPFLGLRDGVMRVNWC
jgi:hypothetical protein